MLRIGHSFHAADRNVRAAIEGGDRSWLSALVLRQLRAGADSVDVGTAGIEGDEATILSWCIALAESASGRSVMIDCANAELLCATAQNCLYPPWLNSLDVSGPWPSQLGDLMQHGCQLVIQLRDGAQLPASAQERLDWCEQALSRCQAFPQTAIWIDAVALPWGGDLFAGRVLLDFLELARLRWPELALLVGLSNLSFGHPDRSSIHRLWLPELRSRGLRGALLDPFDPALMALAG